jgi:hypothetical protein
MIVSDNDADLRTLERDVNGDSTLRRLVESAFSIDLIEYPIFLALPILTVILSLVPVLVNRVIMLFIFTRIFS